MSDEALGRYVGQAMNIGAVHTSDATESDAEPEALVEAALRDTARWFANDPRAAVTIGALCNKRSSI